MFATQCNDRVSAPCHAEADRKRRSEHPEQNPKLVGGRPIRRDGGLDDLDERALAGFVEEFGADTVHLAGGNARRVTSEMFASLPCPVIVNGNESSMTGAARLFYPLGTLPQP